jgi:zinc transporter 1
MFIESGSQMNMKGVYLHIITDFIGSVIVVVTASMSIWFPEYTAIKLYMDPVLSMVMVLLIMSSTIPLGNLFLLIINQ